MNPPESKVSEKSETSSNPPQKVCNCDKPCCRSKLIKKAAKAAEEENR